jgi:hypothetical protein
MLCQYIKYVITICQVNPILQSTTRNGLWSLHFVQGLAKAVVDKPPEGV